MMKFKGFSDPIKGCFTVLIFLAIFWGGLYLGIKWMITSAVQANLMLINAQSAENQTRIKAIEDAQEEIKLEQEYIKKGIKLIEYRTRSMDPSVSRGSVDRGRQMVVTAYTCGPESTDKRQGDPAYCITAPDPKTGKGYKLSDADAWKVVAADPKYHKAGSQLYIEGVGIVTVRDTGGAIKGPNRLDLFVGETDVRAAMNWGKRTKEVGAR